MAFPPNFTNNWDITVPADTQLANLLGQDLRNVRVDVMQRLSLLSGTLANRPTPEIVNATWGGAGFGLLYFSTDNSKVYQWNGAAWVDVTTSVIAPQIPVTQVDLTAQNGNVGPTTILTPAANGFFRLSAYIVLTRVATISSTLPGVAFNYTDADSSVAESFTISNGNNSNTLGEVGGGVPISSQPFYAKGGTNIQYSTQSYASSGATSMQYALHIRLEGPF